MPEGAHQPLRRFGLSSKLAAAIGPLIMLAGFAYLLRATATQWFFYDDWDFLKEASGSLPFEPFAPHNGHPYLIQKLLYLGLYRAFGLRHYAPYMALVLAAHVAVAELTRRILLRAGATWIVALVAALLVLLLGAGWQNIIWAFQFGFVAPLACGLAALLLLDRRSGDLRYQAIACVLLILGLQLSSVGVVMLIAVGAWLVLTGQLRRGWFVLAVPAATYLVWLVAERHAVGDTSPTAAALRGVPGVVWDGLSGGYQAVTGVAWIGGLLGAAVLALGVRRVIQGRPAAALPLSLAIAALAFLALVALQRTASGLEGATASRYVYVVVVLTLPLLVTGWVRSRSHPRWVVAALVAVLAVSLGYNVHVLRDQTAFWSAVKQAQRTRVLATAALVQRGDRPLEPRPDPEGMPQLRYEDVARFVADGALPAPTVSAVDVNAARLILDVAVGAEPVSLPGGQPAALVSSAVTPAVQNGCLTLVGATSAPTALRVRLDAPAALRVSGTGDLSLQLVAEDDLGGATYPRTLPITSGGTWLSMSLSGVDGVLNLPPGSSTVCGLR